MPPVFMEIVSRHVQEPDIEVINCHAGASKNGEAILGGLERPLSFWWAQFGKCVGFERECLWGRFRQPLWAVRELAQMRSVLHMFFQSEDQEFSSKRGSVR